MKRNNHNEIKRQFLALIQQVGETLTPDLAAVLDVFLKSDDHFTVHEFQRRLENEGHRVSGEKVKTALEAFVRYGIAKTLPTDDGTVHFEHLHMDDHHDHLICTKCGRIIELLDLELEEVQERAIINTKFHPFYHRLQVYGICEECIGAQKTFMPLSYASIGEWVRIEEFEGGLEMTQRLMDMGLHRGTEVKVINNTGAFILQIGDMRLAIGRGMINRIKVTPLVRKRINRSA